MNNTNKVVKVKRPELGPVRYAVLDRKRKVKQLKSYFFQGGKWKPVGGII